MPTPIYPSWNDKEYDLLKKMTENTALIADYEIGDVASVAGTAGNVLVNGGTAAATGAITLSLPSAIRVADGTLSAPVFSFSADSDTGLFRAASGSVAYASNGIRTFAFPTVTGSSGQFLTTDGAGNITWGTGSGTLPSQTGNAGKLLTTDGVNASWSSTLAGNLTVSGNTVVSGTSKSFKLRDTAITDSNYDTLTIVASAQKTFSIGVGTLAGFPTQLTINGETNLTSLAGNLIIGAGTSTSGVFSRSVAIGNTSYPAYSLSSTAAGGRYLSFGQDILGSVGSWVWHDETGAAYRMALKGDTGNLLIGTTTDGGQKLQVNGTAAISSTLTVSGTGTSSFAGPLTQTNTASGVSASFGAATSLNGNGVLEVVGSNGSSRAANQWVVASNGNSIIYVGSTAGTASSGTAVLSLGAAQISSAIAVNLSSATACISTSTGALVLSGANAGLGVAGAINVGTFYGMVDGVTAPAATSGYAKIYVDTADGDLKVIFGDGTIKTIATDT